ncbi:hypothetical protein J4E91_004417 [Alternaria rosae]|nr:hypothetical protein J4E91_004417 [Alternaria rosae]
MYKNEYLRAVDLWKSGAREEAYIICRDLLVDSAVGKRHQAGFHLLFGNSEDYKEMETISRYLVMAEEVLARALKDTKDLKDTGQYAKDDAAAASDDRIEAETDDDVDNDNTDMETIVDEEEDASFNPNDWEPCNDNEEGFVFNRDDFNPDDWELASDNEEPANDDQKPANEEGVKENKGKMDDGGEYTDDELA